MFKCLQPNFVHSLPIPLRKSSELSCPQLTWGKVFSLTSPLPSPLQPHLPHCPSVLPACALSSVQLGPSSLLSSFLHSEAVLKTFPSQWAFSWPLKSKCPALAFFGLSHRTLWSLCSDVDLSLYCTPHQEELSSPELAHHCSLQPPTVSSFS